MKMFLCAMPTYYPTNIGHLNARAFSFILRWLACVALLNASWCQGSATTSVLVRGWAAMENDQQRGLQAVSAETGDGDALCALYSAVATGLG